MSKWSLLNSVLSNTGIGLLIEGIVPFTILITMR